MTGNEVGLPRIAIPEAACAACAMNYHGVCQQDGCGCTRTDVDHDPDWDALRRQLGDD